MFSYCVIVFSIALFSFKRRFVILIVSVIRMLVNKSLISKVMRLCWAFSFSVVISCASCVELGVLYVF